MRRRGLWWENLVLAVTAATTAGGIVLAAREENALQDLQQVTGRITWVDPSRRVLVLERPAAGGADPRMEFVFNNDTRVSKAEQPLHAVDLEPNDDPVTLQYHTQGNRRVARAIRFETNAIRRASGKVDAVDQQSRELLVRPGTLLSGGEPLRFAIDDLTVIARGRDPWELRHVHPGDDVMVDYTLRGGRPTAWAITVMPLGTEAWIRSGPTASQAFASPEASYWR